MRNLGYASGWMFIFATLTLGSMACDRKSGDSSSSKAPPANASAPAEPSPADEEKAAVDSFKVVVDELAQRYSKKELLDPKKTDALPLDVIVPRESISVRRTGDLIRPFRGEARGLASLSVPGQWFNDQKPRTLLYDVIWPMNYRGGKWTDDKVSCVAKGEAAQDSTLASLSELVRMRVIMWDSKK